MADERCFRKGCEQPPTCRALLKNDEGKLYCDEHAIENTDAWLHWGFDAPPFECLSDGARVCWKPSPEYQRIIDLEVQARP